MIFSSPAMKKGVLISAGREKSKPANIGASAAPVVLATPVTPAAAEGFGRHAEAQEEPVGGEALDDKSSPKGVERKQRRELEHDAPRLADPQKRLLLHSCHLGGRRQLGEKEEEDRTPRCIQQYHRA